MEKKPLIGMSILTVMLFLGSLNSVVGYQVPRSTAVNDSTFFTTKSTGEDNIEWMNITFESNKYTLYGQIFYPAEYGVYPGIVFCEGFAGYAEAYNWIPQAVAKQGYVVLFFDFPGQGRSEGIFGTKNISIPSLNFYLRFSTFFEVIYHYVHKELLQATLDAITYLTNESPVKDLVDGEKLGLIGHSMGSIMVTVAASVDTRIDAVVALSQGSIRDVQDVNVPIQFQAGCLDSTFSIPITSLCYRNANPPKELITIQGGTHIGFTAAFGPYCLCPAWQKDLCLRYATGWFDYFLKNKPGAYETITMGVDHLSTLMKSRYNFGDGDHFLE
jgi:dienelactone hydrolase